MKYCLIIDNDDQKDQITILEYKSKEQGFPITCYYFKPDKKECIKLEIINGKEEFIIDLELLIIELEREFEGKPIDLIASDYKLEDRFTDGLKLLQFLKENWRGQNLPSLIYSSEAGLIKKKLQHEIQEIISDEEELTIFLNTYYNNHPNQTISRDSYVDSIIAFLKKHKSSLSNKLSQKLSEQPDRIFQNIFPRFNGQKLGLLAKLVQKNTEESDAFENEFLDRSVAHFIFLEE
jgi:hypothetical protein